MRYEVIDEGDGLQTGVRLRDVVAGSSALILRYGFNAVSFRCTLNGVEKEYIWSQDGFPQPDHRPAGSGTPILAPFPNRIAGGRFKAAGRTWTLPCNEKNGSNAIHGFVLDRAWRIVDQGVNEEGAFVVGEIHASVDMPDRVELWPADYKMRCRYSLSGNSLQAEFTIENPDDKLLPFGFGTHPYFNFAAGVNSVSVNNPDSATSIDAGEGITIQSPAATRVLLKDCLPTGELSPVSGDLDVRNPRPIDGLTLDDVVTDLAVDDDARITHELVDQPGNTRLRIIHDASFPYAVLFIPPHHEAICIEPYTCVTNAVNLDVPWTTGWLQLLPGQSQTFRIAYDAGVIK